MSAPTGKTQQRPAMALVPMTVLALAGGAYAFLRFTDPGKRLSATMARDIQAIKERDPAARSDLEILTCYPGLHALWFHRLAHALWKREVPVAPRLDLAVRAVSHRHRDPPGSDAGRGSLHRPRGRSGHRRDRRGRARTSPSTRASPWAAPARRRASAIPPWATTWSSAPARSSWGRSPWATTSRSAPAAWWCRTCPPTPPWWATPGRPVISEGAKVGIPDIDYTHLPDPVAEAMKCLVRRVVQLENELEELRKPRARLPEPPSPRPPRQTPAHRAGPLPGRGGGLRSGRGSMARPRSEPVDS